MVYASEFEARHFWLVRRKNKSLQLQVCVPVGN
jgi:hypothetical protein